MTTKTIQIHGDDGAGEKTLIGRLICECGELGLPQMEKLQQNGIREYDRIAAFFKSQNMTRFLYTPQSQFVIDDTNKPDILVWVVDATASDNGQASSQKLASVLSANQAQTPESLIVAVNKMDLINWSSETFGDIARTFGLLGPIAISTQFFIIPISATKGSNIVETPKEVELIPLTQFSANDFVSSKPLVQLLG